MKILLILLLSLINLAQNNANKISLFDDRIINGEDTDIKNYNFVAALIINFGTFFCAASIISEKYAITAAHCAELCIPATCGCSIKVGATNYEDGTEYKVADRRIHPQYNRNTLEYDGALLKLCKPLVYSATVGPTPYSSSTSALVTTNAVCTILGWGVTETGQTSNILQVATVRVVDQVECNKNYSGAIYNSMFCAADGNKDSCNGDSGGPLIIGNEMTGIVSWGDGCAKEGYPGVYTKLSVLSDWIEEAKKQMNNSVIAITNCLSCISIF